MSKKPQMTTFGKLSLRLLTEHDIIASNFMRTYAGRNQKNEGCWVWCAKLGKGPYSIGSVYPASALVRAKKLAIIPFDKDLRDYEVVPVESEE